jgi:TetR/AcrR family transcriptional regulator
VVNRCEKMLVLLLGFAERNPGITRVLIGDALVGENERLRTRVSQFFERLETQFRQVLREATLSEGMRPAASAAGAASLLLAVAEGRMSRFVRSGFRAAPTSHWQEQWDALARGVFEPRAPWGSSAESG